MSKKQIKTGYIRNLVFGLEDGFVSTSGVLFGIATATSDIRIITLTGIITVLVEATSMGIGSFLTEEAANDVSASNKKNGNPVIGGLIMFVSYLIAGTICLIPYHLFGNELGKPISVVLALSILFFVGYSPQQRLKRGVQMVLLAGLALLMGYIAGQFLQTLN